MKAVIWLTLFTVMLQFSVTEAFTFPLAAIGLGVVGLAGIKLWAVKKVSEGSIFRTEGTLMQKLGSRALKSSQPSS